MNEIWIKFDKISDSDGIVRTQNFVPNDPILGIPLEKQSEGIFITSIPEQPAITTDQTNELHIDPTTNELFWITKPRIKSPEEITQENIANLQSQNAQMILALVNGGLM